MLTFVMGAVVGAGIMLCLLVWYLVSSFQDFRPFG